MRYLLILLILSSCSIAKKVHKTESSTDTKTRTDVATSSETKTDSDTKTKTTTTIEADTTVDIPGSEQTGLVPVSSDGGTTIEFQGGRVTLGTGTLKTSDFIPYTVVTDPTTVPIKFKKTTVTDEEKKVTTTVKTDSTASVKEKTKTDTSEKTKDVERSGLPWWIWLILLLIVASGGYAVYRRFISL